MTRLRPFFAVLLFAAAVQASAQNVAVMGAVSPESWLQDVKAKLDATGMFTQVDTYNIYLDGTPTLAQMQQYCAILVFTDYGAQDPTTFGNNLADYVDGGGGVVLAVFATASVPIAGRFHTDNYYAIVPNNSQNSSPTLNLGTVYRDCHPTLQNVTSFNGGSSSYRPNGSNLHADAVRIADWSDGTPLIVERSIGGRPRIDFGFYPVSSTARADFWDASTDGGLIMANALEYVSSCATPSADLALTTTDDADPVEPGSNVTYTIDVDNLGGYTAENLVITDVIPAGTDYVSATGENSTCSFDSNTDTVTCTLAELEACLDEVVTVVVNVPQATAGGTVLEHTPEVTADTADPDEENNAEAESTTVQDPANLVLTKSAAPEPVTAGETLTYTIDVDNTGDTAADTVVITDVLPAGTTYVSATGENASCGFDSGTVTCTLASLAGGADEVITLTVTVDAGVTAGTTITNTASVSSTPADTPTDDNSDSVDSTVATSADLSITKSGPDAVSANQIITYTIEVTNDGPSNAAGVVVTDELPEGTSFVSIDSPGDFNCVTPGVGETGTVTCTADSMAPGTATFLLRVEVENSPSVVEISNTASVDATTTDPDGAGDSAATTAAAVIAAIPSLSQWGLLMLTATLLIVGVMRMRL
jgi:uncharacterized repeat protein (TIGR01451 family)